MGGRKQKANWRLFQGDSADKTKRFLYTNKVATLSAVRNKEKIFFS